jgi:hypothetical protein
MTAVDELTGMDRGVWLVSTETSTYVLDLDAGTVIRSPGQRASTTINDTTRRLRTLDRCRVGESGYWTMRGGGGYLSSVDFYWQTTSVIRSIEPLSDVPASDS